MYLANVYLVSLQYDRSCIQVVITTESQVYHGWADRRTSDFYYKMQYTSIAF